MELTVTNRSRAYPERFDGKDLEGKDDSICGFEGMGSLRGRKRRIGRNARVAQWWSIALPRRGSRVRIPSRALVKESETLILQCFRLFLFEQVDALANL